MRAETPGFGPQFEGTGCLKNFPILVAVLDEDPTAVAPKTLKDVGVWGTICGGVASQAAGRTDIPT